MYIILVSLLSFVHFVNDLYDFIRQQYTRFVLFIERCRYRSKVKCNHTLLKSKEHFDNLPLKVPKHLAIILGHEQVSAVDLAKLIFWCIVAEIPCISFYDHNGSSQKSQHLVRKKLEELEPKAATSVEWLSNPGKHTNGVKIVNGNNCLKNGDVGKHKTKVYFLSYADCKGKIVTLTQSLARDSDSRDLQEENITPEFLDKKLNFGHGMSDPDLAIVCGKTMCTYGFMPWQTRITEFFLLPTHHDVSLESFLNTLVKFGQCKQRYGK